MTDVFFLRSLAMVATTCGGKYGGREGGKEGGLRKWTAGPVL